MKYLKNVPTNPTNINSLISLKENQVISMALTKVKNTDIRLFSLSKDEEIRNEQYDMEIIYLCLEGSILIKINEIEYLLNKDDCISVSTEDKSHIIAKENAKMMQIMVKE